MRRAAHQQLDVPVVFEDPLAIRVLGEREATAIRANPGAYEGGRIARPLRAFLAVRSRVAEDALAAAVARGVQQYVVLGAGFDTFAYRSPFGARVRVFEVDQPATQGWKRKVLAEAGIAAPEWVRYVPVDFARQNLRDELVRAGLAEGDGAFFSWLGVTMYLERDAIRATLTTVAEFSRTGGGIVFDYAVPPRSLGLLQRLAVAMMARRVKRAGEPWRSYIAPAEMVEEMRGLGFGTVEDLGAAELNARYFANRKDRLRVGNAARIINAANV